MSEAKLNSIKLVYLRKILMGFLFATINFPPFQNPGCALSDESQ